MLKPIEEIANEISRRRKFLKLSQKELGKLSGVSQSTIAKIENIHEYDSNTSYETIKKILDALESIEIKKNDRELKAKDIMNKKVVGVQKKDRVGKAMHIMEKKSYSRLPVFDEKVLVGSISESTIYSEILKGKYSSLSEIEVGKIMNEPFPIIEENTPKSSFLSLLKFSPAILVMKKGEIVGIITKADLLKMV